MTPRLIALLAFAALLAACEVTTTPEEAAAARARDAAQGAAREAMFVKCMELAAKMPRQADDDVADIVQECGAQSHYLTNYIRHQEPKP
jgi:hypothetical protein